MRQYTTEQAASYLGVTRKAVQLAIWRGRLIAWKMGRDWIIDADELKRWDKIRNKKR